MGITGLIPFLEKASKRCNISEFAGGSVAIDSYCWLHKGAFSCADKIALGQPTDAHVKYCMKFVHMLQSHRIKPILVFDGKHLPAKKETEIKRRENRESTRRRAAELMKMGQTAEGRNLIRRSVDITHELALQVIKKCQEENVDCIVAPYEADAQLAYLNITGIADVVITEDSDLTLFGCKKIFFKMDLNGNGLLVEQDRLHLAMNLRADHFEIEKFRHMCILSGCDYLASLPGIGLSKACKFVLRNRDDDIHNALGRLGSYLNMKALTVTKEYRDAFIRALVTFKHQLVYCPLQRKQVRLHPAPPEVTEEQLHYAGDEISEDLAYQMALGNYDPFTMKELHDFDPDLVQKRRGKTNSWHQKTPISHKSIWSKDYKVSEEKENDKTTKITKWLSTAGQTKIFNTDEMKRRTMTSKKRNFEELADELSANDVLELYGGNKFQKNDETSNGRITPPPRSKSPSPPSDENEIMSPILSRTNPFVKSPNNAQVSPSVVCRGRRRIKLKTLVGFRPTVIDDNKVENSKYFSPNSSNNETEEKAENINTKRAVKIVSPRRNVTEKSFVKSNENKKNNDETNIIEETPTQEETRSSSGIFSSEPTEQNGDTNLKIKEEEKNTSGIIDVVVENEKREIRRNSDLLNSDVLVEENGDSTSVMTEENDDNDEREYSINKDNIESFRCSFFKWANTKSTEKTSLNSVQPKQKPIVNAKTKTVRKIPSQRKLVTVESQQSRLNMFGFQKKTVLKHA